MKLWYVWHRMFYKMFAIFALLVVRFNSEEKISLFSDIIG
jgi:hypothetical protein